MDRLLDDFERGGAGRGELIPPSQSRAWQKKPSDIPAGTLLLTPDTQSDHQGSHVWPSHRYGAFLRRNHPYSELKSLLESAAHGI
ncbi:MAG: hypothetical protein QM755_16540 [Luteolibacter sp.]